MRHWRLDSNPKWSMRATGFFHPSAAFLPSTSVRLREVHFRRRLFSTIPLQISMTRFLFTVNVSSMIRNERIYWRPAEADQFVQHGFGAFGDEFIAKRGYAIVAGKTGNRAKFVSM